MIKTLKRFFGGRRELDEDKLSTFFTTESVWAPASTIAEEGAKYVVYFEVGDSRLLIGGPLEEQGTTSSRAGAKLRTMMMKTLLRRLLNELELI